MEDQAENPPFATLDDDFVFSVLHCASIFRIVELASSLIEMKGCDINQSDSAGFTLVIHAIMNNHEELIELLLAQGSIDSTRPDEFWGI